jgi:hypothetical protein
VRIGPDAVPRFEGGSALIVGYADAQGAPYATRAWGAVVMEDGAAVRVFLDADDTALLTRLADGPAIAVTGGCVRTMASAQLKGRVRAVEELTALDVATRERATERFITDVHETDHTERALLDAMVPARFVACTIDVEELYDQTPGPRAGSTLASGAP